MEVDWRPSGSSLEVLPAHKAHVDVQVGVGDRANFLKVEVKNVTVDAVEIRTETLGRLWSPWGDPDSLIVVIIAKNLIQTILIEIINIVVIPSPG